MARAKILSIFKTIAINIVIFFLLLAVVNWGCGIYLEKAAEETRHTLPNYASDPEYARSIFNDYHSVAHSYRPFVEWQMLPYRGTTLTINEKGLREHPGFSESDNNLIVRFFGGSTMWGEGADDSHTIPALFNQQLPDYTVFNHAQLAYNSRQNLDALISSYNRGERSDIVVFYDGVNDAAFLCPSEIDQLPGHRLVPLFKKKLFGGKKQAAFDIFNNLFTENIIILIRHYKNTTTLRTPLYNCLGSDKGRTIANMMMMNWEIAHNLVTGKGGRFIAILQPVSFIGSPKTDHLELDTELRANFREVYYHLKLLIQQKQYPWVFDFTDAFDTDDYIYIDFCHVSGNGNEIIANRLASVVKEEKSSLPAPGSLHKLAGSVSHRNRR